MEDKRPEVAKKIVLEFLDFMKYKVENGLLTMEEIEMLAKTMESNLIVRGTAGDFASYYGKTTENVRNVINRRMIEKPVRRVYYSFNAFRKIVPNTWRPSNRRVAWENKTEE